MRQYMEIKNQHQEEILFFRLGDFYEMFLKDAHIASKELEITLTGRGKDENRIDMCGIPYHAADNYIEKLVSRGYKVAIAEQVEAASQGPGITKREVVKIITPGTIQSAGLIAEKDNNYIAAISEKNKDEQYALALLDYSTGEFTLEVSLTEKDLDAAITLSGAKECLSPETSDDPLPSLKLLKTTYESLNTKDAESRLEAHFGASLSGFGLAEYNAAFPAAWALMHYLKLTQKTKLSQITKIRPKEKNAHLHIDAKTEANLELIKPAPASDKSATLFAVLDKCKTAVGSRRLKTLLKAPFRNQDTIENRLDALESLKNDILTREEIRDILKDVYDLERLISRIVSGANNPKDLLALKKSLSALTALPEVLNQLGTSSKNLSEIQLFFKHYTREESPYKDLIRLIDEAILEDAPPMLREGNLIKPGWSEELDELQASFKSIKDWIAGLEEVEREKTGIKSLKVRFNKVFGYYFEISNNNKSQVPDTYIRKQTLANAERYITPELKEKEIIILNGEEKRKKLELTLYQALIEEIETYIKDIQALSEIIAELDVYQSLATISHTAAYIRPILLPESETHLEFTDNRHPILEQNRTLNFIKNNIKLSKEKPFILITGPNMAGKSTIMRQIALTQIMLQIGCFIPVASAKISIADKLFTRIGALDNLYLGQSTFMVEMVETAAILNTATQNSLIILDEIGRGTSTYDGISIAAALTEYIHNKLKSRTLFATHYHELTELATKLPGLANHSMKITEAKDKIVFNYKLIEGPADKSYGIHVAEMAGMPSDLIAAAKKILNTLESTAASPNAPNQLSLF